MLDAYEKFRMIDQAKKNDFFAEVNYSSNKDVINCQVVKFTFPDGKESFVDKKHLIEMLFAMGTENEQTDMVPYKITRAKWYETILSVVAKKDIRKGEKIVFPIKITLPSQEQEMVSGFKKLANTLGIKSKIIRA